METLKQSKMPTIFKHGSQEFPGLKYTGDNWQEVIDMLKPRPCTVLTDRIICNDEGWDRIIRVGEFVTLNAGCVLTFTQEQWQAANFETVNS